MGTRTGFPGSMLLPLSLTSTGKLRVTPVKSVPDILHASCPARSVTVIFIAFVSVDPRPRAVLDGLPGQTLLRQQVQDIDGAIFEKLGADDVLFVDSRRIRTPDSDVDVLLERVLPTLLQEGR